MTTLKVPFALRVAFVSIPLLAPLAPVAAQTTGTLRGTVVDQEGTVLPGVTVTATSESRGTQRSVASGANGVFVVTSPPVGTYTVSATLDGFHDRIIPGVRIGMSSAVSLRVEMPLASVEETITVSATPVLDVVVFASPG